jgi:hypothetical protein
VPLSDENYEKYMGFVSGRGDPGAPPGGGRVLVLLAIASPPCP